MSKIWKYLDIPNHQEISDEVYDYVVNHTNALLLLDDYLDPEPLHYMLGHCPLLTNFLQQQQLTPDSIGIIAVSSTSYLGMHTDSDGTASYIRITWPIKNCQGSKTKIWKVPDGAGETISDLNGKLYTKFTKDQESELIDEFELARPVLLDVSVPHSVHPNTQLQGDRISMVMGFDRDLSISKSIKAWFGFQR